jgi:hypothetical protein
VYTGDKKEHQKFPTSEKRNSKLQRMKTIKELKEAISYKIQLEWNDPDPIEGNDYRISYIEDIDDDFDNDTPILIQYNNGVSEAEVFLHEIIEYHHPDCPANDGFGCHCDEL